MPRRLLVPLLVALCVVTVSAAACSDPEPEAAPLTVPPPPPVAEVEGVRLSGVEPGRAPRQSLLVDQSRVQVWDGRLTFSLDIGANAATAAGPSSVSMNRSTGEAAATASSGLGPLDVELTGTNQANLPEALEYAMTFEVTPDRQIDGAASTTSRSEEFDEVAAQLGDVHPALPWFILPVPEEPVGRGARWELSGEVVLFGTSFDLAASIRVAEVGPTRYVLDMEVDLTLPGPEPTRLSGTGSVRGTPDRLVPDRAEISVAGGGRSLELSISGA